MVFSKPYGGRVFDSIAEVFNPGDIQTQVLVGVRVDGNFKSLVFVKLFNEECYIVVGNTSAYRRAMYENGSISGLGVIEGQENWYSVTAEEGNRIWIQIVSTKRIDRRGRPYYRWSIPKEVSADAIISVIKEDEETHDANRV